MKAHGIIPIPSILRWPTVEDLPCELKLVFIYIFACTDNAGVHHVSPRHDSYDIGLNEKGYLDSLVILKQKNLIFFNDETKEAYCPRHWEHNKLTAIRQSCIEKDLSSIKCTTIKRHILNKIRHLGYKSNKKKEN